MNPSTVGLIQRLTSLQNIRQIGVTRFISTRQIYTARVLNTELSNEGQTKSSTVKGTEVKDLVKVGRIERRALVWAGNYKSIEDVPDKVHESIVKKAKDKGRIKISIWMMVITAIACVGVMISAKREAARGEGIDTITEKFHKDMKTKYEAK